MVTKKKGPDVQWKLLRCIQTKLPSPSTRVLLSCIQFLLGSWTIGLSSEFIEFTLLENDLIFPVGYENLSNDSDRVYQSANCNSRPSKTALRVLVLHEAPVRRWYGNNVRGKCIFFINPWTLCSTIFLSLEMWDSSHLSELKECGIKIALVSNNSCCIAEII